MFVCFFVCFFTDNLVLRPLVFVVFFFLRLYVWLKIIQKFRWAHIHNTFFTTKNESDVFNRPAVPQIVTCFFLHFEVCVLLLGPCENVKRTNKGWKTLVYAVKYHCHRGVAMILYLRGTLAKLLYSGLRSTLSGPPGQEKVKCCRSDTRKRKISMRARDSPTQDLFPEITTNKPLRRKRPEINLSILTVTGFIICLSHTS